MTGNFSGPPSQSPPVRSPSAPPVPSPAGPPVPSPGDGNTFDGNFPVSGSFPVSYAAFASTPGGAPVSAHDGMAVFSTNGATTSVQLVIPSLNINATIIPDYGAALAQQQHDPLDFGFALNYLVLDAWSNAPGQPGTLQLQFGLDTSAASMPVSGRATFTGVAQGFFGQSYYPTVQGNASLTADFTSGTITGAFTQMSIYCGSSCAIGQAPRPQWNDVSVNASIAGGTNRFTGTTAVTSAPGTPLSLSPSAAGRIDGGFFGSGAQSVGAVWTLSDGANSVIGTLYGNH